MPKVSVLVPVYNAESTLSRCLDSLLGQTIGSVQIICIDDASTDASPAILRQYQQQHASIDVITLPENHGQGYARNQGIPLIQAPFTAFLDSDDYLSSDALQLASETFQTHPQTDCVLLDARYISPDGQEQSHQATTFDCMKGYDAFQKALRWEVHGLYVARTELYQQFPYDDSCHSYSDDNTTMAHYLHAREVRCCKGRYYAVMRPDSCTRQVSTGRFDWLLANESLHHQLLEWNLPHDVIERYEEQRWYVLIDCFWFYYRNRSQFTHQQREDALHILRHAWESIDTRTCLPPSIRYKPGYMPLRPFWTLFKWQEWALYMIRKLRYDQDGKRK